ncbi:uncharacterized protein LOC125941300 [Dermacentor silvarum]|uniref:uncharacterized protein LOC125941300 n=1 Tax=Dermacentor silvarum TaxID=543639 RepID=UPI0021007B62|nr:uncharacterized protein LOC125941300 [Dermacentor silvarum]
MAEKRSTPPAFSSTDEATPSTSRDNTQGASSTLGAYRTVSDGPCPYQWNTQRGPIRDGTYSVDGATDNGSTGSLLQGNSTSADNARPSTSRAGMAEAPALLEDGTRSANGTGEMERQDVCGVYGKVSSKRDALQGHATGHTGNEAHTCRPLRPIRCGKAKVRKTLPEA